MGGTQGIWGQRNNSCEKKKELILCDTTMTFHEMSCDNILHLSNRRELHNTKGQTSNINVNLS